MSAGKQEKFLRFRWGARLEHLLLLTSFTVLAVTGLPQKYAQADISEQMIAAMGGIELVRVIHRYAAFVLVVGTVYHLFTSAYRLFVKHERMRIMFRPSDLRDLIDTIRYNLGFLPHPPKMPKFNFGEKFEYWAVVWGTGVMVLTGFMLWNPIATTAILPGQSIPIAKAAHGGEAVLAAVSIVIWHFYNVLIKHRNLSIFTGYLNRHQMEEEHGLELERLDAGGESYPDVPPDVLRRRRIIFAGVSIVLGGLILAGLVWAFTFEQTAITTVPRVTREAFSPLMTPVP
ncbi:MAG: hypothetical protein KC441_01250 [Anaerolineales bacterium]|nr:hypothetical protein [Anaerolineales bacterium]MCA9972490.1 hypothetical protein [Anaerolineales bacterium]